MFSKLALFSSDYYYCSSSISKANSSETSLHNNPTSNQYFSLCKSFTAFMNIQFVQELTPQ